MFQKITLNLKKELRKNKLGIVAIIIILILVLASLLAFLAPHNPNKINIAQRMEGPGIQHFFGTDDLGRDYFARALYGGRISLSVGFFSMIISVILGTVIGTISGFVGGKTDSLIMRGIDMLMSVPSFFIILIVNAYFQSSIRNIILIIGLLSWMRVARLVRAETLSIKERDFVLYAKITGEKKFKIIIKHIIPNIISTVIVTSSINIATAILMESSLSFLGLGVQPPDASWGSMLKSAQGYLGEAPYLALFPGLLILLTVLSFNILGDIFRSAFEEN